MAEFVFYRVSCGRVMRAKVLKRFKSGGVRVEPWFWRAKGADVGTFQGGFKINLRPGQYFEQEPT